MTGQVRVLLARHGESRFNVEERYQGQLDSGLTATGREQAADLARWLHDHYGVVDMIISSDLPRSRETAESYASLVRYESVAIDARLREVDTGTWSGHTFAEIDTAHPDEVSAAAGGVDVRRGGGETFAETRTRVWAAIHAGVTEAVRRGAADTRPATICLFTHGGPIRVAAAAAVGLPPPGHHPMSPPTNCSVTEVAVAADLRSSRLVHYNLPTTRRTTP